MVGIPKNMRAVAKLLKRGEKEEAVRLLVQEGGLSEKDAIRTILSLENSMNQPGRSIRISSGGPKGIGIVLSLFGLIFLSMAGYNFIEMKDKIDNWVPSKGLVRHLIVDYSEGGAAPVITYLWELDTLSYTSTVYASPPDYKIGDTLNIYINPKVPTLVLIDSFKETYLLEAVYGSIGMALFIIGGLILFFSKRI